MDPYFPVAEYHERWRRVDQGLRRRGLEAAVVWGRSGGGFERFGDVFYLTGYYGTHSGQGLDTPLATARGIGCVVVRRGEEPILIADEPEPNPKLIGTERIEWSSNTIRAAVELEELQHIDGPIGLVGSDLLPMKYWLALRELAPRIEWQIEDELVRDARRIKSERELAVCREGGAVSGRALTRLIEGLVAGQPEAHAAGEAAREVVRAGGHIHMIPCNHGDQMTYFARDPLNGYSQDAPRPGDVVRGWVYGPMINGYWMDPGRTAVCGGAPTDDQRHLVESCARIVERLISEIRPGRSMADVAVIGEEMVAAFGGVKDQAAQKWPHFGHGVGLFFEKPYISRVLGTAEDTFEPGMVLGVEAFLTAPGVGSAGHEDNVIVTATGIERITDTPTLFW